MALISVAELREHIAFLRAVHTESSHGEESLYADGKRLRAAVRAYLTWLAARAAAALLAQEGFEVPPWRQLVDGLEPDRDAAPDLEPGEWSH